GTLAREVLPLLAPLEFAQGRVESLATELNRLPASRASERPRLEGQLSDARRDLSQAVHQIQRFEFVHQQLEARRAHFEDMRFTLVTLFAQGPLRGEQGPVLDVEGGLSVESNLPDLVRVGDQLVEDLGNVEPHDGVHGGIPVDMGTIHVTARSAED